MANDKLKVAVLSMSGMNGVYAETFFENPRVEVVAITSEPGHVHGHELPPREEPADEVRRRNLEAAQRFGVPYVEELDEVLGRSDIQAVTFSSPYDRRVHLVEKMAAAGKHIFADKPLTDNLSDADAVVESVERHGIKLMVGHNYRFNSAIVQARDAVKSGKIGLPWAIHSEYLVHGGRRVAPIGEIRNHAMYPLDAILYLASSSAQTVYTVSGSFFFEDAKTKQLEDLAFITMNLEHDIIASTSVARTPIKHVNTHGVQTIRIMGTHGMIGLDTNRPAWISYGKSGIKALKFGREPIPDAIDHFVDSVLRDKEPMCGPKIARDILEITLAALQSAKENKVVKLPLPR